MRIETIDLNFLGTEEIIASFLLLGDESAALVETGPTTCLDSLTAGLKDHGVSFEDVDQVFLTHIHLDHAGASGHLAEMLPNATFYVHEVGRPHLVDPSKLWKSATRIYGERMDELWGEMRPVPEDRLVVLSGGEELKAAGGVLVAHYTPGHAYHHIAYLEPESGALFAGDVAGIRLPGQSYVRPPTPPPEIDLGAWVRSIEEMRRISPRSLCPTHFGCFDDVERHLGELEQGAISRGADGSRGRAGRDRRRPQKGRRRRDAGRGRDTRGVGPLRPGRRLLQPGGRPHEVRRQAAR
jgi:glyoxylase-like metal-dependent hydrolase (beta-lactamase superfamily II)